MSKFIQIAIEQASRTNQHGVMYALDDEGTIWGRELDREPRPFMECHRSVLQDEPKPKKEKIKKPEQPFHEWFNEIKHNDAYRGIDCNKELGKMKAWMLLPKNKNRKLTKRFVLNWLNKVEPGIEAEVRACPNRVRKEGSPFMKECGNAVSAFFKDRMYCGKCAIELLARESGK